MDFDKKTLINNNKRYVVIEQVNLDGATYLFIINSQDEYDSKFVGIRVENGKVVAYAIEPELFREKVFPLFLEKFASY